MRMRSIARDVTGLGLAMLGALALIGLGTLLASRHEWVAVGLLVAGLSVGGLGVWLGRYDPAARRPTRDGGSDDGIEMVPRVK